MPEHSKPARVVCRDVGISKATEAIIMLVEGHEAPG
jgi:hypothetical protein